MKESLAEIAASSDAAMAKARMKLVAGVREAARAGMTQTEIAAQIGRSQPLGLLALGRLEARISELVDAEVDLVPESMLRHDLRQRVLDEAVPL